MAAEYCIPPTIGCGYCSLPPRAAIDDRYRKSGKTKLILLIVFDFDPDGEEIAQLIAFLERATETRSLISHESERFPLLGARNVLLRILRAIAGLAQKSAAFAEARDAVSETKYSRGGSFGYAHYQTNWGYGWRCPCGYDEYYSLGD